MPSTKPTQLACMLAALFAGNALAMPTGVQVAAGSAAFAQNGNRLTVTNSPGAILNWQKFSIDANETVRFVQPSAQSAVLNRVVGQDPSAILGSLQSNGRVFLVNPNGIVFGQGAKIDVGGLVASSLNISDADFSAGRMNFSGGATSGAVRNQGSIATADGGLVYLIAPDVDNSGIVTAPNGEILLAAGHSVSIATAASPDVRVQIAAPAGGAAVNVGQLIAQSGSVGIYGANVTQVGTIDATAAVVGANGRIYLQAGDTLTAKAGSTTSADGGDITLTSAKLTTVEKDATVRADNGRIKVWSDGDTHANGTFRAANGFIETSGRYLDTSGIAIDAKSGTWLLDPTDITIGNGSANPCTLVSGTCSVAGAASTVDAASLSSLLGAGTSVVVDTAGGGAGSGDITVTAGISWNASSLLTLNANRNIQVNAAIAGNGGSLKLRADSAGTGTGTVSFGAGGSIALTGAGRADIYYNPVSYSDAATRSDTTRNPYSSNVTGTYTAWMLVNSTAAIASSFGGMNSNVAGYYALGKDLDFNGYGYGWGFQPVGWNPSNPFTGKFDGLGHTINNLSITGCNGTAYTPCKLVGSTSLDVGLFGWIDSAASVANLNLLNVTIDTSSNPAQYVGLLAGQNAGTISNIYTTGTVTSTKGSDVGGLIGQNSGPISNSHAAVTLHGQQYVGGLVGDNYYGSIVNSYATGAVDSTSTYVGGLVAYNDTNATISNSYAAVAVSSTYSGYNYIGGLAGSNASSAQIADSYATGGVSSTTSKNVGGLVGNNYGVITRSYAKGNVSGTYDVGGLVGYNNSSSATVYGRITDSYATGTVYGNGTTPGSGADGGLVGYNEGSISRSYATGSVNNATGANLGGLVGYNAAWSYSGTYTPASVAQSFWNTETTCATPPCSTGIGSYGTAPNDAAAGAGATGLTTAQMMTASTFTGAGWSVAGAGGSGATWRIYAGQTFPLLRGLLTPLTITADDVAKTYDGAAYVSGLTNPVYSMSGAGTSGLLLNQADAYGSPVAAGNYSPALYSTQAGYDISYVHGTLTIDPAVLALAVSAAIVGNPTKTYDGSTTATLNSGNFSLNGFAGSDSATVTKTTGTYDSPAAGPRTVTVSLANGDFTAGAGTVLTNYILPSVASGSGTIGQRPVSVTANHQAKTYGNSDPTFTYQVTAGSMVNSEVLSLTRTAGENVGTYPITLGSNPNYNVTYTGNNLDIAPAVVVVVAPPPPPSVTAAIVGNPTKTYDGTTAATLNSGNFALSGFVGGDSATVTKTTGTYDSPAAGPHTVTVVLTRNDFSAASGTSLSNYLLPSIVTGGGTIAKAPLTVAANDATKIYDGLAFAGDNGVRYAGFVNGENAAVLGGMLAYAGSAQGAVNAGTYAISPSGLTASNYALSYADGKLRVDPAPLAVSANDATKTYDGLAFAGGNGVRYAGFVNGENAAVLGGTLAYAGSAQGAVNAGTYAISPSGLTASNYALSYADGKLRVNPASLAVFANDATRTYDGLAFSGGNGVRYVGFVNGEGPATLGGTLAYAGSAQGAVNAGAYAIKPAGLTATNYAIFYVDGKLTVSPAVLTVAANDATKTYDGFAFGGGNGVRYAGFVNGESPAVLGGMLAYGGSAQGAVNAGAYAIKPAGLTATNYALSYVDGKLTVSPAVLTVAANDATKTYDGLAFAGGNGVRYAGFVNGESPAALGGTLAYAGSAQGAVNAGAYAIKPTGLSAANYAIAYVDGNLTVSPVVLTVAANDATKTYDGLAFAGGNGVRYAGFVNGEGPAALGGTLAYAGSAQGAVNAGAYAIKPTGLTATNYALSYVDGKLTVGPAVLTVAANDATKTYDGLAFAGGNGVRYAGFVNGEGPAALGGTLAYAGSAQGAVNAGAYAIKPTGLTATNYALSYIDGKLTVNPATLTVAANDATKTYDGLAFSGGNGVRYAGFVNSESPAVLGGMLAYGGSAQGAVNAGAYAIKPAGLTATNYALSYVDGKLTVSPAVLTVAANDATKTYDGLAFAGGNGVRYAGFVNGESPAALGGTLAYAGSAQSAVNAGAYAIKPTGLSAANYAIAYVDGNLTVSPVVLTVAANDATKTYDGLAFAGGNGVRYAGFVNGEGPAALGGTLAYAGSAQGAVNAGAYAIKPAGLTATNYALSYVDGNLTVSPVVLTVAANDATKTYDGLAFSGGNGVRYAGFVNGEGPAALGGMLAYAGSAQGAVNAGAYVISPSGLAAANYAISYVDGVLTVNRMPSVLVDILLGDTTRATDSAVGSTVSPQSSSGGKNPPPAKSKGNSKNAPSAKPSC